jgi:hypothetical protein
MCSEEDCVMCYYVVLRKKEYNAQHKISPYLTRTLVSCVKELSLWHFKFVEFISIFCLFNLLIIKNNLCSWIEFKPVHKPEDNERIKLLIFPR